MFYVHAIRHHLFIHLLERPVALCSAQAADFSGKIMSALSSLTRARFPLTLAALALSGAAAHAEPSIALDRVSIAAGAFDAKPKISAGVERDDGYLSTGDLEGHRTTLPRVKADVLFGDSQGISFDYYRFDKSYGTTVSGNTTRNGQQFTGTGSANAKLELDLAQLAYKFWIGQGSDVFGVGLGAGYYRAKIGGTATGTVTATRGLVTETRTFSGDDSASESAFAPLVELGYRHAFSPDLRFVADVSGVKKNGGRLNGHIYSGTAGIEWFFAKNVGLVADYGIQKIQLGRDGDRRADLNVKLTGPSAYIKVRF
jgi:hypothetical protein